MSQYSVIKRMEHFIKGLANTESQISAIPPERYGDRFVRFISGVTKTKEAADREKQHEAALPELDPVISGINSNAAQQHSTDRVMEKAEWQAERSRQRGRSEDNVPDRDMRAVRSPSAERGEIGTTLPVVEEVGEASSVGGRSTRSASDGTTAAQLSTSQHLKETLLDLPSRSRSRARDDNHGRPPPTPPKDSGTASSEGRPPTPPKDEVFANRHSGPPTPPKEKRGRSPKRDKELPRTPLLESAIRVR
jgi:1-phosphatidylinositol-4-phosphate 5-kinase